MSGKILRYRDGQGYSEGDVLVVDSSDEEIVRLDLAVKKPLRCFSASTENIEKHGVVLKHYIKYLHAPSVSVVQKEDATQMIFFTLWERLVEDFNAVHPRAVFGDLRRLRDVKQGFFPNLDAILNALELFAQHLMVPCLEGSPFCGRAALNKPRQWSNQAVDWLHSLALLVTRLELARKSVVPVIVPTIEGFLAFVRNSIKGWGNFATLDAKEKCFALSAYTYGLAEMFEERGQYGVSLLLLHRTLDLYFSFCAIGASLLVETASGFEYTGGNYGKAVNALQSFKILKSAGFFAPGLNVESDVRSLNDARNLQLLTHHVYGIKGADAKALRRAVGTLIASIEGASYTRWSQAGRQWLPLPGIDPKCLFELEPSITTYLAEVV
jgi:hypothetical protein